MRRIWVVSLAAALWTMPLATSAAPAGAVRSAGSPVRIFRGPAQAHFGTGGGAHCPNAGIDGTLPRGNANWTFTATGCAQPDTSGGMTFAGSGTATTPRGAVMTVDVAASAAALTGVTSGSFVVTFRSGSGEFASVRGSVGVVGTFDWSTGNYTGTAAGAAITGPPAPRPVDVTFDGTGQVGSTCNPLSERFALQVHRAGLPDVSLAVSVCIDAALHLTGQFLWSNPGGASFSGAFAGDARLRADGITFDFDAVLTVSGGSGEYASASGSLAFHALLVADVPFHHVISQGTIVGTVNL